MERSAMRVGRPRIAALRASIRATTEGPVLGTAGGSMDSRGRARASSTKPTRSFANALLVLASAAIGYLLVETTYRFIQYRTLLDEIVSAAVAQIPRDGQPSSVHDP